MRKTVVTAVAVLLALQLSVMSAFASVYDVSEDTELESVTPIYYTENYVPGMFRDGISTWAVGSYGSYSANGWNPMMTFEGSSGTSSLVYPLSSTPSVNVGAGSVSASYTFTRNVSFNDATLFLSGASDGYFDFQSSEFVFDQQAAQADTFYLNGTFSFLFSSWWSVITSGNTSFYTALDPVGVQFLIDGKPYGDVVSISSYTSPFTGAFTSTAPARATVTFDNLKVYSDTVPELIGFRIYVDSNYSNGSRSLGSGSSLIISQNTTLNWTTQPTITFVKESSSSDADLGALVDYLKNGLFNSNNVPFLDIVISFLQDGLFNSSGVSFLSLIDGRLISLINDFLSVQSSNMSMLGSEGQLYQTSNRISVAQFLRNGFLGLRSLLTDASGTDLLYSSGNIISSPVVPDLAYINRNGFAGLSSNIKAINSYISDSGFSWFPFDLNTGSLSSSSVTVTGQNIFMKRAYQSIEDKLGRLTYVFANDDEIELVQSAKPGLDEFKDSFGGGASVSDVAQMKNTFDDVETLLDTGFDIDDLFDSFNDDSSWLSWFTVDTATSLDSTPSVLTVGDDDPYNHYAYQEHLQAVQALRNRGEGE